MNEAKEKTFKVTQLPDTIRQNIINLLKEEGLSEEQINRLQYIAELQESVWVK